MQIAAYEFNKKYGESVTDPMTISPLYKGLNIGWHITPEGYGFDMNWTNKHTINTAKRLDDGQERTIALKTRLNTLQFGFHHLMGEAFSLGVGLSFGTFKVLKKDAFTTEFEAAKYENFYDKNAIVSALSIYGLKSFHLIGGNGILIKPYVEWYYIPPETTYGGRSTNYIFRTTNIGFTTALTLGSKKKL